MTDIRWRNSRTSPSSSASTGCQFIHESPNMWKYEGYLDEEKAIINRGLESAKRLTAWYHERLKSIEKRANLLDRGLVPVVSEYIIVVVVFFLIIYLHLL
ncbi:unnamed protein product [Onchocerca flexuosa]|uniref:DUF630 family protein n=1 Tax=Onchocerca flexuosa TaxID=387005 RepID=A0A183HLW8_9BILA|nr:unnamed protein product [Onchocerca flexuosa]